MLALQIERALAVGRNVRLEVLSLEHDPDESAHVRIVVDHENTCGLGFACVLVPRAVGALRSGLLMLRMLTPFSAQELDHDQTSRDQSTD